MKYIIMCGGTYEKWQTPKHLSVVKGEPIVARTIRLLRESGVEDIAISSNNEVFEQFGVPVLKHPNPYVEDKEDALWVGGFYPMTEPVCYIFGDVVFSPEAISKIVNTQTDSIEFFASAKPLPKMYPKRWAEPFAFKVQDTKTFFDAIIEVVKLHTIHYAFNRHPIAWELWQVIKGTQLNRICYDNYTVINDYTCDIDEPEDIEYYNRIL